MKICIIANGYPTEKEPQFGCFEKDQALALSSLGHEVFTLYIKISFSLLNHTIKLKRKLDSGISVYGLHVSGFFWGLIVLLNRLSLKKADKLRCLLFDKAFKSMCKEFGKPDVLYAHYLYNIFHGVYLKEKYNIPLVGIEHWSMLAKFPLHKRVVYFGNITYPQVDELIAVSNSLANSIDRNFSQKALVVNNMVGEEFANSEMIDNTKQNKFRFLAIGSLIPIKGFDLLIEAFEKAKLQEKDCELIIIGGGEEKENLQKHIDSLSLSNHVKLVGRKIKKEIISYLRESNVFVLSSHVETFSVVCIEALSIGVPVIATACGGPEEFIQKTDGLLVKPGSVDELSSAMLQMYQNYKDYDRLAISEDCKRRFSPSVIAKQLTEIFEDVVDKSCSKE